MGRKTIRLKDGCVVTAAPVKPAAAESATTHYASEVVAGNVVAGLLVRQACERHLRDLDAGHERGLTFDADDADRAVRFFHLLKHSKGEWAGKDFALEPWQAFIVGSLFGWKREDGTRRFRTGYLEVARKNGKTTLLAGVGLLLAFFDGEPGADVYAAATKREQAKICWGEARQMVLKTAALQKRITCLVGNLHHTGSRSKFEPLGADADSMDGLNIHGAIVDELHAHKTRNMVDVLETATGARRQPLVLYITTAGTDRQSVCYDRHEYASRLLSGTVDDDSYFAYCASIDEGDDWADESVWPKANPNLGVSVKLDDLRRKCARAKQLPTEQNAFLRLHLNVWTQQSNRWLPLDLWDANAGPVAASDLEAHLLSRLCYGGLDLSSVRDLAAWVMVFPDEEEPEALDVLCRFWCPETWAHSPENRYSAQYLAWERAGFLTVTPGDAIDHASVRAQVVQDASVYQLIDLNIDRLFQGHETAMRLSEEGLTVFPMGQGFLSMAAPMKEFERRLLGKKLRHGGNPVLRFMAENVAISTDPAGNLKPDKAQSQGRIDGIVSLVMALDRAMRRTSEGRSRWEEADQEIGVLSW